MKLSKYFIYLLSFLIFLISSCKKIDTIQKDSGIINQINQEKFFNSFRSNNGVENKIINYLRNINKKEKFVNKLIEQIGYPRWNKGFSINKKNKNSSNTSNANDEQNEVFHIPFVKDSQNYVNATMIIVINEADTLIKFKYDWQYKQQQNSNLNVNDSAEYFATYFMMLDNIVFGYKEFKIIDNDLFKKGNNICKIVKIDSLHKSYGNNVWTLETNCVTLDIEYSEWDDAFHRNNNNINNRIIYHHSPYTYCSSNWVESSGSGNGGTGSGPTGNGSNNGGCGSCGGGGFQGPNPTNGTGWTPILPIPVPCDPYIDVLKNDAYFTSVFQYLQRDSVISANVEIGFMVIRSTSPYVKQIGIDVNNPWISWYIPPNAKIDGLLHSHNCPSINKCAATIFSPQDVVFMAQLFLYNNVKDTNNFFFGVTNNNLPYILKVTNSAKFKTFANEIAGDPKKIETFIKNYDPKLKSSDPDINETNFLKMLKDYGVGNGLTLFRGNNTCNEWTKLKAGAYGPVEDPCLTAN